jgi:transposase-like protein
VLVELGLVEQRYKAVAEVLQAHVPVTVVAERYGVGRQAVHEWLRALCGRGPRRPRRSQQSPGHLSAPDAPGRRSSGPQDAALPSELGTSHHLEPPHRRGPRAAPGAQLHLSGPRASSPHRAEQAAPASERVQALGALTPDGALADGHHRRCGRGYWLVALAFRFG